MTMFQPLIVVVFFISACSACSGKPNMQPINENDVVFVKEVQYGKLFQTKNIDPPINVIHVYGTPYQMGFAHGQIVKPYVSEFYNEVQIYLENQIAQSLQFLPAWLQEMIEVDGLDAALELTYVATRSYTPEYFFEELHGLADGSGMDYQTLVNIHMLPELTQASCSMVGAWGSAITNTSGTLYQLRALDWNTDGPFQKWPALIVYHPNANNGHAFSLLSFTGFIGALTGYSSSPMGICEKVWISYNGTDSRTGIPWHFLLRDILQYDNTVDDAITRIVNAPRTCSLHLGVGDPVNKFRAIEYSYERVQVYDDVNYPEYAAHPTMKNLVYINKHVQPSSDPCLGELLKAQYGSIDSEYLIRHVAAEHQTGDSHAAVYDYANNWFYVSIAIPYVNGTYTPAYDRQWTKFDMGVLFAEKPV